MNKIFLSKGLCLGIVWAFFSWVPIFTNKILIYGWVISFPCTTALHIEKIFFHNLLAQMHYIAFLISVIIGGVSGYTLSWLIESRLKDKNNSFKIKKRINYNKLRE